MRGLLSVLIGSICIRCSSNLLHTSNCLLMLGLLLFEVFDWSYNSVWILFITQHSPRRLWGSSLVVLLFDHSLLLDMICVLIRVSLFLWTWNYSLISSRFYEGRWHVSRTRLNFGVWLSLLVMLWCQSHLVLQIILNFVQFSLAWRIRKIDLLF